ncbi:MAG: zinc-binding dehydrogenase [Acidobacteriota bacterium]
MKAMQVVGPRIFELVQVPMPSIDKSDTDSVLVRSEWAALCGSDIPFYTGNKRFREYPMPPGAPIHECVGEVIESANENFRPGDKVLAIPDENKGLAEYFLARSSKAVVLPGSLEDYASACLIQPLATVMNAIDRLGHIRGKSVGIVGLGPMGLLLCWYASQKGAGSITGIDPCRDRCDMAQALGAAKTITGRGIEVVHDARRSREVWDSPDICIEAVGHQPQTINDCLELVRKYGTVVAFGVPDQTVYALEYEIFFRQNALLMATVTPDWADYLGRARDLYLQTIQALAPLATPRMPIGNAAEAYRMYERHAEGVFKIILDVRIW